MKEPVGYFGSVFLFKKRAKAPPTTTVALIIKYVERPLLVSEFSFLGSAFVTSEVTSTVGCTVIL